VLLDVCLVVAHKQELALAPEIGHDIEDGLKQEHGAWLGSLQVHKRIGEGKISITSWEFTVPLSTMLYITLQRGTQHVGVRQTPQSFGNGVTMHARY
jgi:hypothetical protein